MYIGSGWHRRYVLYLLISCSAAGVLLALLTSSQFHRSGRADRKADALFSSNHPRVRAFPGTILWAWERPEDLNFIDPRKTGVAYLAETINIELTNAPAAGTFRFAVIPRRQPLRIPEGTFLIAVARIEIRVRPARSLQLTSAEATRPTDNAENAVEIARAIARLANIPGVRGIQIDFDATVSQRVFYSTILRELRRQIPNEMPISITALASWCFGDAWLDALPIDEAVPMLFRMGVDDHSIRTKLARGEDFVSPVCRISEGISTDEVAPVFSGATSSDRRIYLFHPRSWTAAAFHDAAQGAGK